MNSFSLWDENTLDDFWNEEDDSATATEDPFFSDLDDDLDNFQEEALVPCEQLTQMELDDNVPCLNITEPEEPRFKDRIFERLAAQIWSDFQLKLNTGRL